MVPSETNIHKVLAMMDVLDFTIRVEYPVPDSDTPPPSPPATRHPLHLPEAVDEVEAMEAPEAVETPADNGEILTAAEVAPSAR